MLVLVLVLMLVNDDNDDDDDDNDDSAAPAALFNNVLSLELFFHYFRKTAADLELFSSIPFLGL